MILQSLWFIQVEGVWMIVAGISHDLVADPGGAAAFFQEWRVTDQGIENVIRSITTQHVTLTKRQEWNTPPRVLTVDMQPNQL